MTQSPVRSRRTGELENAMSTDFEALYNNRALVPDHPRIFEGWYRDSSAFRTQAAQQGSAELDVPYGPSARQYIDLFLTDPDAPLALFIHGGYWRALSPKEHSHLARGLFERGVNVAMAGYDITPQVSIGQIVDQMRAACLHLWHRFGKRILVYGHSAGGHLTAAMMATDWSARDPKAPSDLVPSGYAISGLFDLSPLIHTSMNADFKLDEMSARASSPLFWPAPPAGRVCDSVVGADESSEFIRQAKTLPDAWGKAGVETRYEELPGNHFTVIAPLADPDSAMVERLYVLAQRTRVAV
jgi:arylformamidase